VSQPFFFRSWRDLSSTGRIILVLVLAIGIAAAWIFPDWAWQTYSLTITAVSFFTVWLWHRRKATTDQQ
jgi:hypothetical protein